MRFKNYLICLFDFYSNRRVTWCHQYAERFVYFFCIARVCLFFDFFPNRRRHCLVVWRPFRRIGRPIHARIFDERRRLHAAEKKRLRLEKKCQISFFLFYRFGDSVGKTNEHFPDFYSTYFGRLRLYLIKRTFKYNYSFFLNLKAKL